MGIEHLPIPGFYVDDSLVQLFNETIDHLISDMGRHITVYLPPIASGCPNCLMGFDNTSQGVYNISNPYGPGAYNKQFPNGGICPVCKGTHELKTANTVVYKALISRDPITTDFSATGKDFERNNIYKTKIQIVAYEDLRIAEKAMIDGDMCVPIKDSLKRGLRDLKYVQQWWRKMDL